MGGRVYDPQQGRFLSPDPQVPPRPEAGPKPIPKLPHPPRAAARPGRRRMAAALLGEKQRAAASSQGSQT